MRADLACIDGVELLMDYLEDALAATERAAIDAHLALCPRCVAFVRSYCETPRILREATLSPMPAGLDERVRRFLRDSLQDPPR